MTISRLHIPHFFISFNGFYQTHISCICQKNWSCEIAKSCQQIGMLTFASKIAMLHTTQFLLTENIVTESNLCTVKPFCVLSAREYCVCLMREGSLNRKGAHHRKRGNRPMLQCNCCMHLLVCKTLADQISVALLKFARVCSRVCV